MTAPAGEVAWCPRESLAYGATCSTVFVDSNPQVVLATISILALVNAAVVVRGAFTFARLNGALGYRPPSPVSHGTAWTRVFGLVVASLAGAILGAPRSAELMTGIYQREWATLGSASAYM